MSTSSASRDSERLDLHEFDYYHELEYIRIRPITSIFIALLFMLLVIIFISIWNDLFSLDPAILITTAIVAAGIFVYLLVRFRYHDLLRSLK